MTIFQAAILGVVQGVSEFLPISSSGHLVLVQEFFRIKDGAVIFDVFVHFATLLAVLIYFKNEILKLTKKELLNIFVASIPAGLVGLFLEDQINEAFSSLFLVGILLMISGLFNFITEYNLKNQSETKNEVGLKEALFIGLFQALAVLPGVSRSGSTVAAGTMQKIERKIAFRFSFLMVMPVIFGANLVHLLRFLNGDSLVIGLLPLLVGGLLAFISGLFSLRLFEFVIAKAKMNLFGFYCIALGCLIVISQLS